MNHFAEVYLWGTKIGTLYLSEGKPYASFEYEKKFIDSASIMGIKPSPFMMPLADRVYEFPNLPASFRGVPGLIADSLPDKFGNAVISRWLADQGRSESDFNVIDRLCYTGSRGMGALEYVPATGPGMSGSDELNVSEMVTFASDILSNRRQISMNENEGLTYAGLLKLGTSAGGARAKALVAWNPETGEVRSGQIDAGDGFEYWLMKFDGVSKNGDHDLEDVPEYTKIEYAYYNMAIDAGIVMEKCRLYGENGRKHFMTKRFDRVAGQKLHMQTLGALAHIDYNIPGICSYEQAAGYMKQLTLGMDEVEQFFRRMVFNVLAVNQDDHVKNISFLMDRSGAWKLAPAYDITFAYDHSNRWLRAHQMLINGKSHDITTEDLVSAGEKMEISKNRIHATIERIHGVVERWESYASEAGIREKMYDEIRKCLGSEFSTK